jgi:ribosomal protein S18 acetylase RimI-like enzyme
VAEWIFRDRVLPTDAEEVRDVVASTGFFSADEIDVAEELILAHLATGPASGYLFVFAETSAGQVLGYACYGPVPCTARTFDLYWIAVRAEARGLGLGRALLVEVEQRLRCAGGGKLIAETSSREQYAPTRGFYQACGFREEARIGDYYAPGEDILYYTKIIDQYCACGS